MAATWPCCLLAIIEIMRAERISLSAKYSVGRWVSSATAVCVIDEVGAVPSGEALWTRILR